MTTSQHTNTNRTSVVNTHNSSVVNTQCQVKHTRWGTDPLQAWKAGKSTTLTAKQSAFQNRPATTASEQLGNTCRRDGQAATVGVVTCSISHKNAKLQQNSDLLIYEKVFKHVIFPENDEGNMDISPSMKHFTK